MADRHDKDVEKTDDCGEIVGSGLDESTDAVDLVYLRL